MFQPRAADLALHDIANALVHGAVGDYADEAAVLLLINFGHWLPHLQSADLITLAPDVDRDGLWAQITWRDIEPALSTGVIFGSSGEVRMLRAAASIADGHPVDLGDLAAGLHRRALTLLLAAIPHAAGSHEHRNLIYGSDGVPRPGAPLPPLVAWPV